MGLWKIWIVFLLVVCNSCDCVGDSLEKTCPIPDRLGGSCVVHEDNSWSKTSSVAWELGYPSRCRLGKTKCDQITKDIYCDDFIPPADEEECNDIDDDCDGEVDEDLNLDWDHPDNDCDTGLGECGKADKICALGSYHCRPLAIITEEQCDGLDNDCDGVVDNLDPVECWEGPDNAVFDDSTICKTGFSTCINAEWTICIGSIVPEVEVCDGIDNDCDGEIDTDAITNGTPCGPASETGACTRGEETCVDSESICVNAIYSQNESCDAADNDCDGEIDEDLWRLCSTVCGPGIETCDNGAWVRCTARQPTLEICDGIDNDCDGEIDEGCPCVHGDVQTCTSNIVDQNGISLDPQCGVGVQICEYGLWGQCEFWGTFPEECNNWDDDCDGTIDDIIVSCGDLETAGIGECLAGEDICLEGAWQGCEGAVYPEEEICDLLDNNCDGLVDEGLDPNEKVDMIFIIDISYSMFGYIYALKNGIATYVNEFSDTEHLFGLIVYGVYPNNAHVVWTTPSLVDVNTFLFVLSGVSTSGSGIEPTYDALLDVTDANDPLGIRWRSDATPYVIVMTDEYAQTQNWVTETDVASQTSNCQIGNCVAGDYIEIFIITHGVYFNQYDTIVYGENNRLINILPADANRYTQVLRSIFQNVCLF